MCAVIMYNVHCYVQMQYIERIGRNRSMTFAFPSHLPYLNVSYSFTLFYRIISVIVYVIFCYLNFS